MKKQLDLGSGNTPRIEEGYEGYGIDIAPQAVITNPLVKCGVDLAISPTPFDDDSFDLVTAYDFMEHIPSYIYFAHYPHLGEILKDEYGTRPDTMEIIAVKRNSMIELFNDIYRVLKPGGEFFMVSPCYPDRSVFQDPGHVYVWTEETPHYFAGDYFGFHDHYGHTSRFQLLSKEVNSNRHLEARFRAIKSLGKDEPYTLSYTVTI